MPLNKALLFTALVMDKTLPDRPVFFPPELIVT